MLPVAYQHGHGREYEYINYNTDYLIRTVGGIFAFREVVPDEARLFPGCRKECI